MGWSRTREEKSFHRPSLSEEEGNAQVLSRDRTTKGVANLTIAISREVRMRYTGYFTPTSALDSQYYVII
jgi:hypothetical protein